MGSKKQFQEVLAERIKKLSEGLAAKEKEYSSDKDRYYNFQRAAEIIGQDIGRVTPESSLLGMLAKHLVCVIDMLKYPDHGYAEAYVDEKFGDSIAYLTLGEGMLKARGASSRAKADAGRSLFKDLTWVEVKAQSAETKTPTNIHWVQESDTTWSAFVVSPCGYRVKSERVGVVLRIAGGSGFRPFCMGLDGLTTLSLGDAKQWVENTYKKFEVDDAN